MVSMFCVQCGKEKPIYKNGVCLQCYLKENTFTSGPSVIDITTCTHCGGYQYKHTWVNESLAPFLKRILSHHFTISSELQNPHITTDCTLKHKTNKCTVTISGSINDQKIVETHPLTIRLKQTTCPICSRQRGGYYESILQIRGEEKNLPSSLLKELQLLIESYVHDQQSRGHTSVFITEIVPEHGRLDFYLSDKNLGQTLAKKIYENYGGTMQHSSKNAGMKDGQQLYRMTYLIRLPKFHKTDILQQNNHFYLIKKISGNKISSVNLSNWEKTVLDSSKLKHPQVYHLKDVLEEMILISQSSNELQVMHPRTYTTFDIKKPKSGQTFAQDTISVIKIDGHLFLKPE